MHVILGLAKDERSERDEEDVERVGIEKGERVSGVRGRDAGVFVGWVDVMSKFDSECGTVMWNSER